MSVAETVALLAGLALFIYLVYALLRGERL
jgi:K+-transporting ATPase KdpF subunit